MDKAILEEIGLTKSEINVYIALLELGSSTTGKVVEKSKASSSKIYEILDRLMQKGLVSYVIKSGVKYFESAPPERIMDYMKEKEARLKKQTEELKKIVPELDLKRKLSKYKSEATIYKGLKGAETAFTDSLELLKPGDELLVLAAHTRSEIIQRFFIKFQKKRAEKKVKQRIIFNEENKGQEYATPEANRLSEIKFVPQTTPASFEIFNDRVIIFPEAEELLLIVIDNKEVAESFRVQFEMWWQQDTSVVKGFDAFRKAIFEQMDEFKAGDSYDVLGAAFGLKGYEKKYADFFRGIHEERVNRGIKGRLLFQHGTWETIDTYRKELCKENCEVKFLPYKTKFPVAIFPSEKKTLLAIQKEEPTVITINNEEVSQAFRKHFESRWDDKAQTYEGQDAVETAYNSLMDSAKPEDDVVIFAAKPETKRGADYNVMWTRKIMKKVKDVKLLYYGDNKKNRERAKEIAMQGCETKIMPTAQTLPISTDVSGDFILNAVWGKEPIAFKLENKTVADSMRANFDMLWKQNTITYEGADGVKSFFNQLLNDKEAWFIGGNFGIKKFPEYWEWYKKERIRRKSVWHDLVDAGSFEIDDLSGQPYYECKILPPELKSPHVICITNTKVANILWAEDKTTIFVVENKELVESYKKYFELLWNQEVTVGRGVEGVKDAWNKMLDELEPGEEYYVMGAADRERKELYGWLVDFHKRRQAKKVKSKFLFVSGTEKYVEEFKDNYTILSEVKYLPEGVYKGMQFNFFKNKVLIIVWRGKEPIVFTIEDKTVYQTFKTYFDNLWEQDTRIVRGLDAIQGIFDEMLESGSVDLIGARGYFVDKRPEFIDDWEKRAIKKGFKMRNIVDPGIKGHRNTKFPFVETKYTLPKEFANLSVIWIFGNKVVISNWVEEEPTAVIIENKALHDMYKAQFELLWGRKVHF